ncbi:MAG: hypothetical protein ACXW35_12685, partial [Nitrospira sp.]
YSSRRRYEVEKPVNLDAFLLQIVRNVHEILLVLGGPDPTRAESNKRFEMSQTGGVGEGTRGLRCSRTAHAGLIEVYLVGGARCMRAIMRQCGLCKRNQVWLIIICRG